MRVGKHLAHIKTQEHRAGGGCLLVHGLIACILHTAFHEMEFGELKNS